MDNRTWRDDYGGEQGYHKPGTRLPPHCSLYRWNRLQSQLERTYVVCGRKYRIQFSERERSRHSEHPTIISEVLPASRCELFVSRFFPDFPFGIWRDL